MGIIGFGIFKRVSVADYKSVKSIQANKPDVELSIERDGKRKETRNSVKKESKISQAQTEAYHSIWCCLCEWFFESVKHKHYSTK